MSKTIYYKDNHGNIIDNSDIEKAFRIVSGKCRFEDEQGYLNFLYGLFGKTVVAVASPCANEFLAVGAKNHAIKLYRDENKCSLSEAREAIERKISELF